jgi:hypothetical protein
LSIEKPVAQAVVEHKQWSTVWEPEKEGGHGGDHLAESKEDGRIKWLEIKKDQSRENSDSRPLYDHDGKPLQEQVNGKWVDKKGEVMQGSRDWMWQKIHDMQKSDKVSDQQAATRAAEAMRKNKLDYVLVTAEVDVKNQEIKTSYYESEPQPGATTGVPLSGPGKNMTQPVLGPQKIKLPEDYPLRPKKK